MMEVVEAVEDMAGEIGEGWLVVDVSAFEGSVVDIHLRDRTSRGT